MTDRVTYRVLTRRDRPYHDAGYWSEHWDLRDAIRCAKQVAPARLYRVDNSEEFGTEDWSLLRIYRA